MPEPHRGSRITRNDEYATKQVAHFANAFKNRNGNGHAIRFREAGLANGMSFAHIDVRRFIFLRFGGTWCAELPLRNRKFTLRAHHVWMARTDSDSDVGRRLEPRARTKLIAELVTLRGLQQVCVESLSPHGAGLSVDDLPEIGSEIVLAWPVHAVPGTVAWAEGRRCGVLFSREVAEAVIEEIIRTSGGTYIDSLARLAKSGSFLDLGKI